MANHTAASRGKSTDLATLHETIENTDNLTQRAFTDIAAIAALALEAIESPQGRTRLLTVASALRVIHDRATDASYSVHEDADAVGCAHIDVSAIGRSLSTISACRTEVTHA